MQHLGVNFGGIWRFKLGKNVHLTSLLRHWRRQIIMWLFYVTMLVL